jgi:hypothetical protein
VFNATLAISAAIGMLPQTRILGFVVLELVPPAAAAITGVALACGRELPVRRLRTALYMVAGGAALIAVDGFGVFVGFSAVPIVTTSVAVACLFLAMRHRNPAVSRTVLVIATYVSVVVASFRVYRSFYQGSVLLDVLRLIAVAAVPVVVFVAGALLIRRHERRAVPSSTDVTATGAV